MAITEAQRQRYTSVQGRYKSLCKGKEEYLVCANDAKCFGELNSLFLEARRTYTTVAFKLCELEKLYVFYKDSLKPSLSAATVGGLVSGIAGGAAGVCAAVETAQENAVKEANRERYPQQIAEVEFQLANDYAQLELQTKKIEEIIEKLPNKHLAEKDIAYREKLDADVKTGAVASAYKKDLRACTYLLLSCIGFVILAALFAVVDLEFGVIFMGFIAALLAFFTCIAFWENRKLRQAYTRNIDWEKAKHLQAAYREALKTKSYAKDGTAICDTLQ